MSMVRVTSLEGEPLLALDGDTGELKRTWGLHGAGRTIIRGVPVGQWRIEVTALDGRVWSGVALVDRGSRTLVNLP